MGWNYVRGGEIWAAQGRLAVQMQKTKTLAPMVKLENLERSITSPSFDNCLSLPVLSLPEPGDQRHHDDRMSKQVAGAAKSGPAVGAKTWKDAGIKALGGKSRVSCSECVLRTSHFVADRDRSSASAFQVAGCIEIAVPECAKCRLSHLSHRVLYLSMDGTLLASISCRKTPICELQRVGELLLAVKLSHKCPDVATQFIITDTQALRCWHLYFLCVSVSDLR